jgi:hypothetical protein
MDFLLSQQYMIIILINTTLIESVSAIFDLTTWSMGQNYFTKIRLTNYG